jgi:hypothetical protein
MHGTQVMRSTWMRLSKRHTIKQDTGIIIINHVQAVKVMAMVFNVSIDIHYHRSLYMVSLSLVSN